MSDALSIEKKITQAINQDEKNTLSSRLKHSLRELNLSQSELARRLGIKPQIIQYICANNVKKSQFTYDIANALGVDYTWLATGEGFMNSPASASDKTECHPVPVISATEAKQIVIGNHDLNHVEVTQWTMAEVSVNPNCFALLNTDNAMELRFPIGSVLVFNPKATPKNHDYALVYLKEMDKLLFRKLEINDGQTIIRPLEQELYKDYILSDADTIGGVLIAMRYTFKE